MKDEFDSLHVVKRVTLDNKDTYRPIMGLNVARITMFQIKKNQIKTKQNDKNNQKNTFDTQPLNKIKGDQSGRSVA